MGVVTALMAVFSMLGAIDRILGNRFGLGKEFEKGIMMLGTLALSMIGMIVVAPLLAQWLQPVLGFASRVLHLDPSIIPVIFFSNDMGGAVLAAELAQDETIGYFNGLVVASMMGCTVSFAIPVTLGIVKEERRRELLLGLLCGIVTIPVGCFVAGLVCGIALPALLMDLLPLLVFSVIIAWALLRHPEASVKVFGAFGKLINILITVGLALSILRALTGLEPVKGLASFQEGADVCLNASLVMTGSFPMMYTVSLLLSKPLRKLGDRLHVNETAAAGLLCTLAAGVTTYEMMNQMDRKGVMINAAFSVSAAFMFAGCMAFTLAFNGAFLFPVIVGKTISGLCGLALALAISRRVGVENGQYAA